MTTGETLQQKVAALDSRWSGLQDDLSLKDVSDNLGEVDTTLATLPVALQEARARGYAFRAFLERKLQVLQDQWAKTRAQVLSGIADKSRGLHMEAMKVDSLLGQLRAVANVPSGAGMLPQVDGALTALERKVAAEKGALSGMFDDLRNNVSQTKAQLDEITFTLEQVAQASFRLLAGEDIVLVVKAQWDKDGKDDPQGMLFLTDGRMLFERKEEVAKKKVLFVVTEKEMVQQLMLEVALGDVENAKATSRGLMGNEDWLEFTFQGHAPVRAANFHIWYESKDWQALYGRVKSGEIDQERAKPKDQAAVEAVKAAPTKCTTCGASITAQIVKGMTQITCDYCGTVIRL
jgi:hypothetical protein